MRAAQPAEREPSVRSPTARSTTGDSGIAGEFITSGPRPEDSGPPGRSCGRSRTAMFPTVSVKDAAVGALPKMASRRELKIEELWPHKELSGSEVCRRRFDFGGGNAAGMRVAGSSAGAGAAGAGLDLRQRFGGMHGF